MLQPLVVTHLDAYQVEHTVLHGYFHALPTPTLGAVIERRQNGRHHMDTRPRIADLRARTQGRAVFQARGAHRPAHRLGDGFIGFQATVWTVRAIPFNVCVDDPRVDLLDGLPWKPETVQHTRAKILH